MAVKTKPVFDKHLIVDRGVHARIKKLAFTKEVEIRELTHLMLLSALNDEHKIEEIIAELQSRNDEK